MSVVNKLERFLDINEYRETFEGNLNEGECHQRRNS